MRSRTPIVLMAVLATPVAGTAFAAGAVSRLPALDVTTLDGRRVRGYPTWLLVAKDGRILARDTGLDAAAMQEPAIGLAELERWVAGRLK